MNNKPKVTLIAAVCVLSAVMLASCRELPGKEAADNQFQERLSGNFGEFNADDLERNISEALAEAGADAADAAIAVKDQLSQAVAAGSTAVAEAGVSAADDLLAAGGVRKELTASLEAGSASTLKIDNAVGEVHVVPGQGAAVEVKAAIIVHSSKSDKDNEQLLESAEVAVKKSGDTLTVITYAKDHPKQNLWSWAQQTYGHSDISINYTVQVPPSLTGFDINTDVGRIRVQDVQGTFELSSDVGAVSLQNAGIRGKSSVSTETGNIDLDLTAMDKSTRLKAESAVGHISAALAEDMKVTLDTSTELGGISGAKKGKQEINGGGPLLSLSTEIGSITVQR
ncbi:DUF4097 family beta strand repeat-containing protein [Paenibacillus tengchongensis]|uniref:DUF4097 family beta strand repeat-containing protein n=1 Tax=Paenibacillus tengchongensis TaxID=2608684 RepID=UPI00124CB38C|nr:DUF4097 family beta strand repeat-containing protein [Paenibacillus tengchongensis]